MNETSTVRRVVASLTIGSFSIAALMGIAALLGAGEFGENQARVLLTTLVVGAASICILCYLATAGTRWFGVGVLGAATSVLPVVTALVLVWSDWDGGDVDGLLRTFGVGVVIAVSLAQACLLLALAGSSSSLRLALGSTLAMVVTVAAVVCGLITEIVDGEVWKFLGVVAILDVLGTLVTIALAKFNGRGDLPADDLTLRVALRVDQAAALSDRARTTGRTSEDLVREAVQQYLEPR